MQRGETDASSPTRESGATSRTGSQRPPSKGDRREQALLDAIEELLLRLPFKQLSVGRIAAEAGVSRTSFYFYFRSKEVALQALVERTLASIWENAGGFLFGDEGHLEALRRGIDGVVDAWDQHGPLLTAVVDASSYDAEIAAMWRAQLEGFIDAVETRVHRDAAAGLAREGIDPRGTAEALVWMNERLCYVQLGGRGPRRREPETVAAQLFGIWRAALYPG